MAEEKKTGYIKDDRENLDRAVEKANAKKQAETDREIAAQRKAFAEKAPKKK